MWNEKGRKYFQDFVSSDTSRRIITLDEFEI